MSSPSTSVNWHEIIGTMSSMLGRLGDPVLENLRGLLEAGRRAVNSAEAGLMIPTEDGNHLRFLVSVNSQPGLAEVLAELTVPCEHSIAGCVFNTGQLIATANPESFYQKVDEKTGLTTKLYLATPVIDDEDVLGVATFVNRPEGQDPEPFNASEIEASMRIADFAAIGLRQYQRTCLQQRMFRNDLSRVAARTVGEEALEGEPGRDSPLARTIAALERLSNREQGLALTLINALGNHVDADE